MTLEFPPPPKSLFMSLLLKLVAGTFLKQEVGLSTKWLNSPLPRLETTLSWQLERWLVWCKTLTACLLNGTHFVGLWFWTKKKSSCEILTHSSFPMCCLFKGNRKKGGMYPTPKNEMNYPLLLLLWHLNERETVVSANLFLMTPTRFNNWPAA